MWHISQVVGKQNLAPTFMAKEYLTNPGFKESMTAFTFDKGQIEMLRKDILSNPQKYEQLLLKERQEDPYLQPKDHGAWKKGRVERRNNWIHKYKMLNDGRGLTELDNWPLEVEYHNYKIWADGIKNKAMDTLKLTVSRLLLDFEHNDLLKNRVSEFESGDNETKKQALSRLMDLLGGQEVKEQPKKKGNRSRLLLEGTKSIDDLRNDFYSLIDTDAQLGSVFGTTEQAAANPLIKELREELLSELLQLVETAMLQRQGDKGSIDPKNLQDRLSQLTKPSNARTNTSSQLRFVDSFLAEKTNKDAIGKCIEQVKPFFFQLVNERLELESNKLLKGLKSNENKKQVF